MCFHNDEFSRFSIVMAVYLLAAGCGGDRAASLAPGDDEARSLVREALAAWRDGKVKDLARREPPLRFVDPDLAQQSRLLDFHVQDTHEQLGHVVEIPVTISLQDKRGKQRSHNAVYQVATQPGLAVLRSDP
jgi:hypothetical protein